MNRLMGYATYFFHARYGVVMEIELNLIEFNIFKKHHLQIDQQHSAIHRNKLIKMFRILECSLNHFEFNSI